MGLKWRKFYEWVRDRVRIREGMRDRGKIRDKVLNECLSNSIFGVKIVFKYYDVVVYKLL